MDMESAWKIAACFLMICIPTPACADALWNQAPVKYSATRADDPFAKLDAGLKSGTVKFRGATAKERAVEVLERLGIPTSSQILVFSKTSKQNDLISPGNPRAVYFSDHAYAAWVPGGIMEIITHDADLGPVFYSFDVSGSRHMPATRERDSCFSCHGTAQTQDVPGVIVRSVFPDSEGKPMLEFGSFHVDSTTPLAERWGGYYVTGSSSLPHLGNLTFPPGGKPDRKQRAPQISDVSGQLDASVYPVATSDIVALLVLEHQCQVHNLLTAASYRYRKAAWMAKIFSPDSKDSIELRKIAADDAKAIAAALLFKDAASLGEGVEGSEAYQLAFTGNYPKTKDGETLAEFHLGDRLFTNRCSYMIYSRIFSDLPEPLKTAIAARLRAILTSEHPLPEYSYIGKKERARITAILEETWPPFKG